MLTQAENERLTRVGPGTAMGTLFRHYWQPIAPAKQLAERNVMPVRLYGEDLVLFRDGRGRIGLVGDRCAHRLVKLECGYATNAGLRCPYHGWTYDVTGQCVDQPGEPTGSTFKDKVTIPSYPVDELAGLIFAYLGPLPAPLLPRWDRLVWDNVYRVVAFAIIPCNWLQCMENTPDPIHTEYLHGQYFMERLKAEGVPADDPRWALARGFATHVIKHEFGFHQYGIARRSLRVGQSGENDTWSSTPPLVFPNTHVTSGSGRHDFGWRIPIDDTHTMQVMLRAFRPGNGVTVRKQESIPYYEMPVVDAKGNYASLDTVNGQDWMVWVTQDPIYDRTRERLGDSDRGIILYRQLLQQQLERVEAGLDPINVFRDPAQNESIELPAPWDRGYAWGYAKDGSYIRGTVTTADRMPEEVATEIEDLFCASTRETKVAVASV
jgi:5,5'-dehydrodivanillate O-demethylase oxygenase subunit